MQVIYNIFIEEYIIMLVGVFDQKKKISEVKNLSPDTQCSFCILLFFCHHQRWCHVMSSTQRVLWPPRPLISCTPVAFGDEGPLISFTQRHLWHSAALTSLIHQRCRPATGPLMKQLANQVARGNVDLWGRPSPRRQTHILSRRRVYLDHRHRPLPLLLLTFSLRGKVLLTFPPSDESLLLVVTHTGNAASLQSRRHLCCSRLNCTVMDYTISISCYCSEVMSE